MSTIIAKNVQLGNSLTPSENFTLQTPDIQDGSIKISRGNSGNTTADILSIDANNNVIIDSSLQDTNGNAFTPFAGFKNKIINGNFDIWQRGTSQTSAGYGSDDRWHNWNSGSTKTHSLQSFTIGQTDVPGNPSYFSRTVVSSVAGASNNCGKLQRIENVTLSSGKTMTLSFWAKADGAKNIAIEFLQNFGTGGSPSAYVEGIGVTTFSLTTSWQKFTATVTFPSIAGKTLGTNNDDYYHMRFWFDAGSDYNSRSNSLGQQSGTFDIAQVQLEEGSIATPFEMRPYGLELSLCERYCELINGTNSINSPHYTNYNFRQLKRTTPSYTLISGTLGGATMTVISNYCVRSPNGTIPTSTSGWLVRVEAEL